MRLTHIAWNLGGLALPLVVAVLTVPGILATLGAERFGLLALAWGLIGYAGALDLGLGRALTQMVSRLRGERRVDDIPSVLVTATRLTRIAGLTGALAICLAALLGAGGWLNTSAVDAQEIFVSILLLAIALPAQAMSATYRGMNDAYLNFKGTSLLRAALGVMNFCGPFCIAQFTDKMPWLIASLVASRVLALFIFRRLAQSCLKKDNPVAQEGRFSPAIAKSLFAFGGWVVVSAVISPVLVQADRFVIAATMSAAAVSVYVLPYEVVVQSLVVVGAVSSVLFPNLSRLMQEGPDDWQRDFNQWLRRVAILMGAICASMALLMPIILPLWLKESLTPPSILIGQILCLGVFANAIGSMYYTILHARGRSEITAKLHLIELPVYLAILLILIQKFGVVGAALAWVFRMALDALLLYLFARQTC